MTEHTTDLSNDDLDQLAAELENKDETISELQETATELTQRAEGAERERDGAYRERAQLLALLAALHPSVIAPAPDVDETGWQILYLRIGGRQASWHVAPRDAELLAHVEHVPVDDRRAQWDGHTTEQKYQHIGQHAAQLYAEARGRVETPPTRAEAVLARIESLADEYPVAIDTALIHEALAHAEQPQTTVDNPTTSKEASDA